MCAYPGTPPNTGSCTGCEWELCGEVWWLSDDAGDECVDEEFVEAGGEGRGPVKLLASFVIATVECGVTSSTGFFKF